jgi:DNA-binding GntR family transcriptional regulator
MNPRQRGADALPPDAPADTRLRYQLIHDKLKRAIGLGRIAPGLVLLEGPVARIFGTSRVPVRKAFELLHEGGLLHTFEGRGYLVPSPDGSVPAPLRTPLSEQALGLDESQIVLDIPSNSERIYNELEAAVSICIAFGHFRVDESAAADAFNVSRGTVREALNRLRDRGLVEKSAYSHWLAGPLTARAVAHDYELRMLLEPAALIASAPLLDPDEVRGALAEVDHALRDPDSVGADALHRIETALHVDCLRHSPNKKLLKVVRHSQLPLTVNRAFYGAFNLHPDKVTLDEHRAVLVRLLSGDIDGAAAALGAHLRAAQKRTSQKLKVLAVLPEPDHPEYLQRIA